jgi:hypothetical protein
VRIGFLIKQKERKIETADIKFLRSVAEHILYNHNAKEERR